MSSKEALYKTLGSYLKNKRVQTGLTQAEVAKKLNYASPQFISNFERGLCSPPLKNLKVLVKLYSISVDEILDLMLKEQEEILRSALIGARVGNQ
ncbi:MAG: helix-turn-helix transcriptional regulator [Bdellovibrionales bacterium]|nr:helix-turn-helix transcriptional regulator [Bdellovibrionales bacterium]